MSYKLGDRVICIRDIGFASYSSIVVGGSSYTPLGKLFTIVKIKEAHRVLYYCSGYEPHDLVFYEEEITLATPLMEELL